MDLILCVCVCAVTMGCLCGFLTWSNIFSTKNTSPRWRWAQTHGTGHQVTWSLWFDLKITFYILSPNFFYFNGCFGLCFRFFIENEWKTFTSTSRWKIRSTEKESTSTTSESHAHTHTLQTWTNVSLSGLWSVCRFVGIEMKSVKFEDSLFEDCFFEDISSIDTVFENCTIRSTLFYNTGQFTEQTWTNHWPLWPQKRHVRGPGSPCFTTSDASC